MILTVSNNKGGVGKTSISFHVFHFAKKHNLSCLFVSLDTQTSTKLIFNETEFTLRPTFEIFTADFNIDSLDDKTVFIGDNSINKTDRQQHQYFLENMAKLNKKFDLIVLDTPPAEGALMKIGLLSAEKVIIPFQLNTLSINGIKPIFELIKQIATMQESKNEKPIELIGILPNMFKKKSKEEKQHAIDIITKNSKYLLFADNENGKKSPVVIADSVQIPRALEMQKPFWEIEKAPNKELLKAFETIIRACGFEFDNEKIEVINND